MRRLCILLLLLGCAQPKKSGDSATCPGSLSTPSNLSLTPSVGTPRILHANGINTTWNWQVDGVLDSSYNVNVYDVDLFETTSVQISALKASGKKVICQFSAGSSESWQSDFGNFLETDKGFALEDWEGERWLDVRSQNVFNIMKTRMDLAKSKGCDGVEPDNVDGYDNDSCFSLTYDDQLAYNRAIANYARSQSLSVALKNDPAQVADLVAYFDFSITEECYSLNECASYQSFTTASKPILNAEYASRYHSNPARNTLCSYSNSHNIQTLVLSLGLDNSYRHQCF